MDTVLAELTFNSHGECEALSAIVTETIGGRLQAKRRLYPSGTFVWNAESKPERVFQLKSGRVEIITVDHRGNEVLIRAVKAGEIFGEICLCKYSGLPHGTFARAATAVVILEARFQDFQDRMHSDPAFAATVLRLFCSRIAESDRRVQILSERDARERLKLLLAHLAEARGTPANQESSEIKITITHAELAMIGGLSRPHLSVMMAEFRDDGLISYSRGSALRIHLKRIRVPPL